VFLACGSYTLDVLSPLVVLGFEFPHKKVPLREEFGLPGWVDWPVCLFQLDHISELVGRDGLGAVTRGRLDKLVDLISDLVPARHW
jgi:hypothetical protein